jgi:hypothetical protein
VFDIAMPIVKSPWALIDHNRATQENVGSEDLRNMIDNATIGAEAINLTIHGVEALYPLGRSPSRYRETFVHQWNPGKHPVPEKHT